MPPRDVSGCRLTGQCSGQCQDFITAKASSQVEDHSTAQQRPGDMAGTVQSVPDVASQGAPGGGAVLGAATSGASGGGGAFPLLWMPCRAITDACTKS